MVRRTLSALRRGIGDQDVRDVVLGVALCVFSFVPDPTSSAVGRPLDLLGALLICVQTLPIAIRRKAPLAVLVVCGVATIVDGALGYATTGGPVAVFVALYTVAANTDRSTSVRSLVYTAFGLLVAEATAPDQPLDRRVTSLAITAVVYAVAWLIGDNLRVRRAYLAQLEERARYLEREREENARLAVDEERARIARELHDVVAHHVSVMVVQAAGARRVLDRDPGEAREALVSVEATGRQALVEMRRMVGVLRAGDVDGEREPQPGLDRLDDLITQLRDAGLPVELVIVGDRRDLPAGVDLSAYRIVQEALTNVLRHAGHARTRVRLAYAFDGLDIEVSDDGLGAAARLFESGRDGHGLIGMRERVALFGGRLEAGPRVSGGYVVSARLPLEDPAGGPLA